MNNKSILRLAGHLNGKKGGVARAKKLTKEQLSEIGRKGAKAMWANHPERRKK